MMPCPPCPSLVAVEPAPLRPGARQGKRQAPAWPLGPSRWGGLTPGLTRGRVRDLWCGLLGGLALSLALPAAAAGNSEAPSVSVRRLGQAEDARPALHGPAYYLKGDGPPESTSFSEFARAVAQEAVDVVVLGGSWLEHDAECRLLVSLDRVNSCTTIVIRDPAGSEDPAVLAALKRAELVYFRGGDQCHFVRWKFSALHDAVQAVVARGGGVGGGSAGLAIQGALAVYDGCTGSVTSRSALADPYRRSISFTHEYFDWPHLAATVTDSHFVKRDRMGRLMTFLCRQQALGRAREAWGLGIEEGSVVVVDRDGQGKVHGEVAYVLQADGSAEGCSDERHALSYEGFKIWRLGEGDTFDFAHRPRDGYYRIDVEDGVLSADPYQAPAENIAGRTPRWP